MVTTSNIACPHEACDSNFQIPQNLMSACISAQTVYMFVNKWCTGAIQGPNDQQVDDIIVWCKPCFLMQSIMYGI